MSWCVCVCASWCGSGCNTGVSLPGCRAHESVKGWDDPRHSKYYCVIVQVGAVGGRRLARAVAGL